MGKISRNIAALLALLLLGVNPAASPAHGINEHEAETPGMELIAGQLDGRRERIDFSKVTLTINGSAAPVSEDGHFSARVPASAYYQLAIGGENVFPMVQTFGGEELRDAVCACLLVPAIEPVERREGRVELFFGGDTMAGRRYLEPGPGKRQVVHRDTIKNDLAALFRPMQPYYAASDIASVNLETVLADSKPGGSPNKLIVFYSPLALADAIAGAGIDYVSLGNNHTYDYLDAGLDLTEGALDRAGVRHSGSGAQIALASAAEQFDLPRNRLSLLGFVGWAGYFKPNLVAEEGKGGAMHGSDANIAAAMNRERRAGRVPIMQLHTGTEYADEPTEFGVKRMRLAIDEGAPLVASHHPHVTQGFELYNGGLIAYSLGNFMFDQNFVETQISFTLKVWMDKGKLFRAEVIPIQILDYRPVPAVGTMREALLRRVFALSSRRDTHFRMSGGHAVVRLDGSRPKAIVVRDGPGCGTDATGILRRRFALALPGEECRLPEGGRFGRDLTMRGDFENARYEVARDRTWATRTASSEIRRETGGNQYLALLPQTAGQTAILYTEPYFRKLAGRSYSLVADIRLERPASVELAVKDKPPATFKGKPSSPWKGNVVGKIDLPAAPGWQRVRFDFTRSFAEGAEMPPLRPILTVTYRGDKAAGTLPIGIDNFALVEWQNKHEDELPPGERWLWTHWSPGPLAVPATLAGARR